MQTQVSGTAPECPECWFSLSEGHVCRCEFGLPLATHPPLPDVETWRGWRSRRLDPAKRRDPTTAQLAANRASPFRRSHGRRTTPRVAA